MIVSVLIFNFLLFYLISTMDHCTIQTGCNSCMRSYPECAWCSDRDWDQPRCFPKGAFYIEGTCQNLVYQKSTIELTSQTPLDNIIQVTPQQFKVNLRPKMPTVQRISVKPKEGYPIDAYYLMDFSYSMLDDLHNLRRLADNLTAEFQTVSDSITIGLGTFMDKVALPYSYTDDRRLQFPCNKETDSNGNRVCQPAYSFRNEMNMSSDVNDFKRTLDDLKVSANIDADEGGLDALMQVVACSKQFGFRENSRKIVIFMTDQGSHIAGDGKLGGIIKQNDGKCHTESTVPGNYLKSLELDYPSIEQVNRHLIEKDVIPIFAVGEGVVDMYRKLSEHMTQLSSVGKLSSDGSNLLDVVKESLKRITTTINLVVLRTYGISVEVTPLCRNKNSTHSCTGVKPGQTVDFDVKFSFDKCDENTPAKVIIPIVVTGFSTVLVEVITQCSCDCEEEKYHYACMEQGHLTCGTCQCEEGYYGDTCNCSLSSGGGKVESRENLLQCTATEKDIRRKTYRTVTSQSSVAAAQKVCSNSGTCECGKCKCRQPETPPSAVRPYVNYGKYCECNNYDCPKGRNGEICSGDGFCDCGTCNCNVTSLGVPKTQILTGGPSCGCKLSTDSCKNEEGEVCSGKGECVCGVCQCNPKHRGKYCQICDLCGPLNCQTHTDCVLCRTLRLDVDTGETCSEYCNFAGIDNERYRVIQDKDPKKYAEENDYQLLNCGENNDNKSDCVVRFYIALKNKTEAASGTIYMSDEIDYEVLIDAVVWCDDKISPVWMAVAIVSAFLVPCMFALVVWKIVIRQHDKREYLKFEEQNKNAKWKTTESPLYHSAITNYNNPLYKKLQPDRSTSSSIRRNLSFLRKNTTNVNAD